MAKKKAASKKKTARRKTSKATNRGNNIPDEPIAGRLFITYEDLDEIVFAERNPKDHDHGAIDGSIETHGFVEPPTINEATGRLVAGQGRITGLRQRKDRGDPPPSGVLAGQRIEEIRTDGPPVVGDRWFVPVVRGNRWEDDRKAQAYLVGSNRISEIGGWLGPELLETLTELYQADLLESTGFDPADLEDLTGGAAPPDPNPPAARRSQAYRVAITCVDQAELDAVAEAIREALRDRWPDLRLRLSAPSA